MNNFYRPNYKEAEWPSCLKLFGFLVALVVILGASLLYYEAMYAASEEIIKRLQEG